MYYLPAEKIKNKNRLNTVGPEEKSATKISRIHEYSDG